ncbi:CUB domain [Trinorchestia longiramus]|nr:CUB domain [Trinorchestia longiramus]
MTSQLMTSLSLDALTLSALPFKEGLDSVLMCTAGLLLVSTTSPGAAAWHRLLLHVLQLTPHLLQLTPQVEADVVWTPVLPATPVDLYCTLLTASVDLYCTLLTASVDLYCTLLTASIDLYCTLLTASVDLYCTLLTASVDLYCTLLTASVDLYCTLLTASLDLYSTLLATSIDLCNQLDLWTVSATGCRCSSADASSGGSVSDVSGGHGCACCAPRFGCPCGPSNPHRCAQCGLQHHCNKMCNVTIDGGLLSVSAGTLAGSLSPPADLSAPLLCWYSLRAPPGHRVELQLHRLIHVGSSINGTACRGGYVELSDGDLHLREEEALGQQPAFRLTEDHHRQDGHTRVRICGLDQRLHPPAVIFSDTGRASITYRVWEPQGRPRFMLYYNFPPATDPTTGNKQWGGTRVQYTGTWWGGTRVQYTGMWWGGTRVQYTGTWWGGTRVQYTGSYSKSTSTIYKLLNLCDLKRRGSHPGGRSMDESCSVPVTDSERMTNRYLQRV